MGRWFLAHKNATLWTQLESTRPIKDKKNIEKWAKSVQWLKLEVLETTVDTVKFNAFFFENGKPDVIHENSNNVKFEE